MAVVTCYVDVAGAVHSTPSLTAAAVAATPEVWDRFQFEWQSILASSGLPFFHMTDFNSGHGLYRGWSKDKRFKLLKNLIKTMRRHLFARVSVTVFLADYERVNRKYQLREKVGGPYVYCVRAAIEHLLRDLRGLPSGRDAFLEAFVARGDKGQDELHRFVEWCSAFPDAPNIQVIPPRRANISGTEVRYVHAFEAADIVAWEFRRAQDRWKRLTEQGNPSHAIRHRRSLRHIGDGVPGVAGMLDEQVLEMNCKTLGIPTRQHQES